MPRWFLFFVFILSISEYYPALKNTEILLFVTAQMNQEGTILSEISQTQKNKYYMIPLI